MKNFPKLSLHPLSVADTQKQTKKIGLPQRRISLFGCNMKHEAFGIAETKAEGMGVEKYVIYEVAKTSTDQAAKDMYLKHKYVFALSFEIK